MKNKKEVKEEMQKAYNYGAYLIAKTMDSNEKFLNHKPMCSLCLGTGFRTSYKYGIAYRQRCESSTWDESQKRLICAANKNALELELENKKDLSSEIWKIIVKQQLKEGFNAFLKQDYQTDKLSNLLTQQLYTILCGLSSGRLFRILASYQLRQNLTQQLSQENKSQELAA